MDPKRQFIVIVTLVYTAAAVAALGFLSDGFRAGLMLGGSAIVTTLVASLPAVVLLAVIAYWKFYDQRLALLLVAVILGSAGYVAKTYHDAYDEWLPSSVSAETATSGNAVLRANGRTLTYRLELDNPGTVTHREYLVVTRDGRDRRIRLPLFDDARSGYVSAKTPGDWIALHPTADTDVYRADTGRFLFVHKSFRVDLRTGEATVLSGKMN
jgi:hypothetical protein